MAKRYKQSVRDRMDEGEGMAKYYEKEHITHAGDAEKRRQYEDSMMIHEDHSAPANLPQECIHKYYPSYAEGMKGSLDDTIRGVDKQIGDDVRKMRKERSNEKY
jgi:hypothetical protein